MRFEEVFPFAAKNYFRLSYKEISLPGWAIVTQRRASRANNRERFKE
jgi:hypothetical protein